MCIRDRRSGDDAKEEESGLQTTPFKTVRIRKRDADHVAKRIKLGELKLLSLYIVRFKNESV